VVLHVVQKFEETLKPMLNVESTKECMWLLLLINAMFHLWQNVLLEWERCNILDGSRDVPTHPPKLIGKSTFDCMAHLNKIRLEKLVKRPFTKIITIRECLTKGRKPKLKSMYEFRRLLKRKFVI
jgi:hypothetical protein